MRSLTLDVLCRAMTTMVKSSSTPPGSPHISESLISTRTRTSRRKLFGRSIVSGVKKENGWRSLGVSPVELNLPLTVVTGQTFRWRSTGDSQFTGVVGSHLISLRQCPEEVLFLVHTPDEDHRAEAQLRNYLNLDTSLEQLYADFTLADVRFAAVAPYLTGARLLRQNPVECVFQFICSSNNHISRISGMVKFLSSLGCHLGTVQGHEFHTFPSLTQLASLTESQLRDAGFGYRAKFIVGTAEALLTKDGGGEKWLLSLRKLPLEEVVKSLCTLPGVGPKVAACIALFSMDQHHAIPVDTHVWQIAVRYLVPELADRSLTLKVHQEVQDAFVKRFGKYAGWAHTVLFIAELSSLQNLLPEHLRAPKQENVKVKKKVKSSLVEDADSGDDLKVKSKRKVKGLLVEETDSGDEHKVRSVRKVKALFVEKMAVEDADSKDDLKVRSKRLVNGLLVEEADIGDEHKVRSARNVKALFVEQMAVEEADRKDDLKVKSKSKVKSLLVEEADSDDEHKVRSVRKVYPLFVKKMAVE